MLSVIALSLGEREYYGMVKGASIGLGLLSALRGFEIRARLTIKSDASAAVAIASRRGLGKVRRIEGCQLRLQEYVRKGIRKSSRSHRQRKNRACALNVRPPRAKSNSYCPSGPQSTGRRALNGGLGSASLGRATPENTKRVHTSRTYISFEAPRRGRVGMGE